MGKLICRYYVFQHRFWNIVTGAVIPPNCDLGRGLLLTYPTGVVIHPETQIGKICQTLQQDTNVKDVKIGGHVDIGAGAKNIRPVTIGDHAKLGANAVVTCDMHSRCDYSWCVSKNSSHTELRKLDRALSFHL